MPEQGRGGCRAPFLRRPAPLPGRPVSVRTGPPGPGPRPGAGPVAVGAGAVWTVGRGHRPGNIKSTFEIFSGFALVVYTSIGVFVRVYKLGVCIRAGPPASIKRGAGRKFS